MDAPLYDFSPIARLLLMAILMATAPLAWVWLRNKNKSPLHRLRALTFLTLFLTFDLLGFGAFTRLTDSGLGCPDWPGCYGSASPIGARDEIHAAQSVQPHGPVTHSKAWIEMIHRYLAAMVGVLITVLAISNAIQARRGSVLISPWWSYLTFVAVCVQGAFGALTVTLKLYPAIVTLHLLGGMGLLMLLMVQAEAYGGHQLPLTRTLRVAVIGVAILSLVQITLGAWVSTNYAVLACTEFPGCQGQWWPAMDFQQSFSVFRHLGRTTEGEFLSLPALTAIHMVHRWAAVLVLAAILWLAFALWQRRAELGAVWAWALVSLAAWQLLSGLSNVILGWPLLSALAHTLGAAILMCVLTMMTCRAFKALPPR